MLQLLPIKTAMLKAGVTPAYLAKKCGVVESLVNKWLAGVSLPRPKHLVSMAVVLSMSYRELVVTSAHNGPPDPLVAFGPSELVRNEETIERAMDMARHLRYLLPRMPAAPTATATATDSGIKALEPFTGRPCGTLSSYASASAAREELGLAQGDVPTTSQMRWLLQNQGVPLIPMTTGVDRGRGTAEDIIVLRLPESNSMFVAFNLEAAYDEHAYWLAYAYGQCLTMALLPAPESARFATLLAYWLMGGNAAPAFVSKAGIKNRPRVLRSKLPPETIGQHMFGPELPSPQRFVARCEALYGTPVFKALAAMQREDGGRNPASISRATGMSLFDAYAVSHELWDGGERLRTGGTPSSVA